jgi:hypothetical protein
MGWRDINKKEWALAHPWPASFLNGGIVAVAAFLIYRDGGTSAGLIAAAIGGALAIVGRRAVLEYQRRHQR